MFPNTMYPNIPEGFPEAVRKARVAKGISLRKAAKDLGFPAAAKLSQLELGKRNFSYENAVLVRDYLEMDFVLPPVDLTQKVRIFRNREKKQLLRDPFYINVDGEVIKVMTYYKIGPIINGHRISTNTEDNNEC